VDTVRELAGKIKLGAPPRFEEPMAKHTSFRIGGPADLYLVPEDAEELSNALSICRRDGVPCFLLGGGTNILVADRGVRGVVIDLSRVSRIEPEGQCISAECGAEISRVSETALRMGLAGLEFAYALPGTVGGAVWMNARCYDREMSDVLRWVDWIDTDGSRRRLAIDPKEWSYKRSPFQGNDWLILKAGLELTPGDPVEIQASMSDHRQDRERKGHFRYPCAGSVFKNNRAFGAPTGKLVDSLGLNGRRIGGAQIAPYHGNIIINTDRAAAADVRELIELVEREVRVQLGFQLEREVLLVGDW